MHRLLLLLTLGTAALHATASASAQTAVSGTVADSTGEALAGATVVLLHRADSTLAGFAAANADGAFRIRAVAAGGYVLRATFVGFAPRDTLVSVGAEALDVGRIVLRVSDDAIGELVVRAQQPPVVVRHDTLDYDATQFRVAPGSSVEDLLRRLPGVEVDRDGTVRAQGQTVERVTVDGKEFFGDDPTVATRNLPADAVDRVQVFDKKSDSAEFTGVDDGERERTINLALKEDRKVGAFGNVTGAAGGSDAALRYDTGASVNRFAPKTQLSVLANANNVNRLGFAFEDAMRFSGGQSFGGDDFDGGGSMVIIGNPTAGGGFQIGDVTVGGGNGDGLTTTWSGGVNAGHDVSDETEVHGSYFGTRTQTDLERSLVQRQAFGDGLEAQTDEATDQTSRRLGHRLSFDGKHEFGEGHDLRVRAGLRANDTEAESGSDRQVRSGGRETTTRTDQTTDAGDASGDARVTYRRRLGGGRSLVAEARGGADGSDGTGDLTSDVRLLLPDGTATEQPIAQTQADRARSTTGSGRLLFTQPLGGERRAVQVSAEHRITSGNQSRTVADVAGGVAIPNADLSSGYDRTLTTTRGGVKLRDNGETLRLDAGLDVQRTAQSGEIVGLGSPLERDNLRLLPSASISYSPRQGRNASLRYRTSTREPGLRELQPVPDVRNPLDVYVGNPDLRPEYVHSLSANLFSFDAFTFTNLFAFAQASYTASAISTARSIDDQLRQTTTPVNTGGAWTAFGNASYGTPVRALRSKVNVSTSVAYRRGVGTVNGAENTSESTQSSLRLGIENRKKERLDLQVSGRLGLNTSSYSLADRVGRTTLDQSLTAEAGWTPTDAWDLRTTLDVTRTGTSSLAGRRTVPLWAAEATRTLMGGRVRIQVQAEDLLNQNLGLRITDTAQFAQEERVNTLGRHVLLRATVDLAGAPGGGGVPPPPMR